MDRDTQANVANYNRRLLMARAIRERAKSTAAGKNPGTRVEAKDRPDYMKVGNGSINTPGVDRE